MGVGEWGREMGAHAALCSLPSHMDQDRSHFCCLQEYYVLIKNVKHALAGVAQWIECWPVN